MITGFVRTMALVIAVLGYILNWWNGWVILLVLTSFFYIKKNGEYI